jgi:hypothetical protein
MQHFAANHFAAWHFASSQLQGGEQAVPVVVDEFGHSAGRSYRNAAQRRAILDQRREFQERERRRLAAELGIRIAEPPAVAPVEPPPAGNVVPIRPQPDMAGTMAAALEAQGALADATAEIQAGIESALSEEERAIILLLLAS